jgi:hypothetical protein
MASLRNITYEDQGVNWRVTFEYNNDQQTGDWVEFVASFPADFGEINPDDVQTAMLELALQVARGKGVDV